jgi:hypothetical protein
MIKEQDKLIKKIVEILRDYKFNSTQISTAEQIAERIIGIAKQEAKQDFKKLWLEWIERIAIVIDDKLEFGFCGEDINLRDYIINGMKEELGDEK